MATDLTGGGTAPEPATTSPSRSRLPPQSARPHRLRFGLIYGSLAVILGFAIVGVAIYAGRSINPDPAWSSWKPKGGGLGAAQEIADHVAQRYRLPNGDQLVDVISRAPSIASSASTGTIPIRYVTVRRGKANDQLESVSSTNSVMYSLCGLGASCEIATGTPSLERGRLVRREILELALYTFKYAGGIQSVIAFMPATAGKTTKYVVYLRKSDLADELKQPLATTLGKRVPLPKAIPAREVRTIDTTTEPRLFSLQGIAQAATGDLVFVLAPVPT